ncbi:quinone-dependent dihydroorotate dehydrogenase [Parvibium lacunae]|uniref:Dihydroorotate dehydrogenase (quinone) n=1 Tax=Parvibium lacunae TaxID=1888893 RepID=A0A368L819_9BURK|nr:quinone-dependent dihydroorotate dehydrogenase [Parvibium lacunae]RCS59757.1 quinone-dependent dihydroorotate dehydrogenase [Parvibium lacunae]
MLSTLPVLSPLYPLARPLLFSMDAETAHHFTLNNLKRLHQCGLLSAPKANPTHAKTVMGLKFPNAVGLAAGLDKDASYIDALAALGFGFIEVGTVTPRPQPGNPKPRMFRLPQAQGIINRMGFNNSGVEQFVKNVQASQFYAERKTQPRILGLNIGKNADTPIERAVDDYVHCLERVYPYASYVTVNISSPNTKNLRQLQGGDELDNLLATLKTTQYKLAQQHGFYVPLTLKIAPDLDAEQIRVIADTLLRHKIDGVIATNTTLSRDAVKGMQHGDETGGLSGAPVKALSTQVVRALKQAVGDTLPIIGVGGILSGADAKEKIEAGASLVQLYSGLIYRGPGLISESINLLK